jgi:hypothetical protein
MSVVTTFVKCNNTETTPLIVFLLFAFILQVCFGSGEWRAVYTSLAFINVPAT